GGDVEVLHHPHQVAEPEVDELDALVLDVGEDLLGVAEPTASWSDPAHGRSRLYAPAVNAPSPVCFGGVTGPARLVGRDHRAAPGRLSRAAPARPRRRRLHPAAP